MHRLTRVRASTPLQSPLTPLGVIAEHRATSGVLSTAGGGRAASLPSRCPASFGGGLDPALLSTVIQWMRLACFHSWGKIPSPSGPGAAHSRSHLLSLYLWVFQDLAGAPRRSSSLPLMNMATIGRLFALPSTKMAALWLRCPRPTWKARWAFQDKERPLWSRPHGHGHAPLFTSQPAGVTAPAQLSSWLTPPCWLAPP